MGLFGQSSPLDADIDKATSEKNTSEPWGTIMDICDKISSNPRNAKESLKTIMKRMGHNDPHVVIQAVTLLDACISNCGKSFHLEVASREFENEYKRLLSKVQPQVALKMRQYLKKWAENEFKSDPQLNLIPSLYQKLKSEGHDFTDSPKTTKSTTPAAILKDPNVVTSQQEEEDIAKAIELSLKDSKTSPNKQNTTASSYPSLYPSFSANPSVAAAAAPPAPEPRKVKALYDFEAAEENEMTFFSGEIIHVIDDSDPNWWKGYNQRGEGLFPSNFVTADLSVDPEKIDINIKSKKTVQFDDDAKKDEKTETKLEDDKAYVPEINEMKIDRLLHLLHEANPEDSSQDSDEMLRLESEANKMGPLIDAELERVDRKHAQLTQLSSDLVDAINLYHSLMREDRNNMPHGAINFAPGFNPQQGMYGHNPMYNMPPNMYQQGVAGSIGPVSLPTMPMMQMMPIPQSGPPHTSHPQQLTMMGNSGASAFAAHPQQAVPIQFQNGHPPPQLPQQPSSHHPQPTSHLQQSQQPNQMHNVPPSSMQVVSSAYQMHQQPQQPSGPPQTPNSSQANPNYIPHSFASQPSSFPANVSPLAPAPYHMQPNHPQIMHNGPMGSMIVQPPPLGISSNLPLHLQQQMSAINQPVTQTILEQSDSKSNIPVYQQQR